MKNKVMKIFLSATMVLLIVSAAGAEVTQEQLDAQYEKSFIEQYGKIKEVVPLRPADKETLALAAQWSNPEPNTVPPPSKAPNGAVAIVYGTYTPRILCRPLRVTDVQLEPGERMTSPPYLGDTINWQIYPAVSGSGENTTYHIMIKPIMPDIATNLVIHTDRRTYTMDLVSHKINWTPCVVFTYPNNSMQDWVDFIRLQDNGLSNGTRGKAGLAIDDLNFDYTAKTNKKGIQWQPLRIWDDGLKTYIEFSSKINAIEAPVLMLMNGRKQEIVNYRKTGNYYIIDKLIKKAVLTLGSGTSAERIVITRNEAL